MDHRQPFAQLEGVYQMAFVAEGCTNGFAPAYRTPTYTARLEQVENRVTVVLPDVPPLSWFPESPRLWGLIGPEHLSLTNYMGNEQWFGLFEQKSPTRLLSILVDEMTLTGSSERLSGAFAGAFLLYEGSAAGWPHVVDRCSSTDHGVTLTRVPGR